MLPRHFLPVLARAAAVLPARWPMIAAADVPALVRRMRSGSRVGQLQAANQLYELFVLSAAEHLVPGAAEQHAFAAAGGIEAAVWQLRSGAPAVRPAALKLLGGACFGNAQCADAVVSAGGIAAMLSSLQPGSSAAADSPVVVQAARALGCALKASPTAAQAAADAGAIDVLTQLLTASLQQAPNFECWEGLCIALAALAQLGEQHAADIAARGAIQALVRLLAACSLQLTARDWSGPALSALTSAIGELCIGSPERVAALVHAAVVPALVRCLSSQAVVAQRNAALLLHHALLACPSARAAIIAAGGDSQLQILLSSSYDGARQCAAGALTCLAAAEQQQAEVATAPSAAEAAVPTTPAQPARPPRMCAAPTCCATSGLRRCGGCGTVRYCSVECSRAHWREHKAECRRLQAVKAAAAEAAAC